MFFSIRSAFAGLPPLSASEEHDLFVEYEKTKSPKIRSEIVERNLGLVGTIANDFHPIPDIINEGLVGLVKAVDKFNVHLGHRFSTFARWWIRGYMFDHVFRNTGMAHATYTAGNRKLFFNLTKTRDRLLAEGKEATPEEIAEVLSVQADNVVDMQTSFGKEKSLSDTVGRSTLTISDSLVCNEMRPDEAYDHADTASRVQNSLESFRKTLARDVEHQILNRCILEEETLQAVALDFGISRERARQISNRVKDRMKKHFIADQVVPG